MVPAAPSRYRPFLFDLSRCSTVHTQKASLGLSTGFRLNVIDGELDHLYTLRERELNLDYWNLSTHQAQLRPSCKGAPSRKLHLPKIPTVRGLKSSHRL